MNGDRKKPRAKVRGNGQGCAYQRPGQSTWTVEVVVGWRYPDGDVTKPKRPVRKTKGGFKTKKAALDYVSELQLSGSKRIRMTMEEVYLAWKSSYESRVDASTMACYVSAYKHFSALHGSFMDMISPSDLQQCMDNCEAGKRTHQNMRTIAGLLWKYAIDKNVIDRDITRNLYTGKGQSVQREPITDQEEAKIREAIGKERYAEYIFCLCWLGYRPGEMLQLRKDQLFCSQVESDGETVEIWYFINGKKTEAGRDRIVIVPDEIVPIILDRVFIPGTDLVFPQYNFSRVSKKNPVPKLTGFKQMTDGYFREFVFKPITQRLGIAEGKVPYGARHTYANKLKNASGTDKDKASLIGHSKYMFTQSAYQSSTIAELKAIVDSFRK